MVVVCVREYLCANIRVANELEGNEIIRNGVFGR